MPTRHEAMIAPEYRVALARLQITPYEAGPVLGISRRQSLRYAAEGGVPDTIAKLLHMLDRHGIPRGWRE